MFPPNLGFLGVFIGTISTELYLYGFLGGSRGYVWVYHGLSNISRTVTAIQLTSSA